MASRSLQLVRKYARQYSGDIVVVDLTKIISVQARGKTSIAVTQPISNFFGGNWFWVNDNQEWYFTVPDPAAEVQSIREDLNAYYNGRIGRTV